MSKRTSPEAPAYPVIITGAANPVLRHDGLTKREYFAAAAMQGLVVFEGHSAEPAEAAKLAVQYADALIDALNEGDE